MWGGLRGLAAIVAAALLAGAWVYCVLQVVAARLYRRVRPAPAQHGEPVSILKPLYGLDAGLERNLRTFFEQDYPEYELLFAARDDNDAGLQLARRLAAEYSHVAARFFVTGEPPWPNAKAWSLETMMRAARNDVLVMSDSDIQVTPGMLSIVAAEFADPGVGVATCPYRAVAGPSLWSELEAIGMNTEFWGGVFAARMVERGVRFAVGPTIAARRSMLIEIGGWRRLSEYLAEDFVLGRFAAAAGHGVILSSCVVEHGIGAEGFLQNMAHRLRWNRSTRRSRREAYLSLVFTNPLPLALLLTALWWPAWPVLIPTAALRAWAAAEVAVRTLRTRTGARWWLLLPLQDLLSFALWLAGFHGNRIVWRGRTYRVLGDGRFELLSS